MDNSRRVYSTELGRICPSCEQPGDKCSCRRKKVVKTQHNYPDDGIVRIRREVKGRKGKTVTSVFGVSSDDKELKQLAKTLKRRCGTGGTVKDGVIIIQGDHRKTLQAEIERQGFTVKLAGG